MKICFATNNANKLREIRQILGESFEILSLKEIDCVEDLPETHETLELFLCGRLAGRGDGTAVRDQRDEPLFFYRG